jgi:dTDP-4-dehydrorhamnose reductase
VAPIEGDPVTWLVIGAHGQLGSDLMALLGDRAVGLDVPDIDITDLDSVADAVYQVSPAVVVNCAAYTDVDRAETDEARAQMVNGTGAANVAEAARMARLIHISTDYVFDGSATTPYSENATPDPRTAYGKAKLRGEQAALQHSEAYVVRTAWMYGVHGTNFVKTMLRLERAKDTIDVVDDQTGQPTWSLDLAAQIILLGESDAQPGIYHGTNSGQTTWFELARRIFALVGADPDRVRPTTTKALKRPAPRPAYSVLGHAAWGMAGLPAMRPWREALDAAVPELRHLTPDS